MNRKEFLKTAAAGLIAASVPSVALRAAARSPHKRPERRSGRLSLAFEPYDLKLIHPFTVAVNTRTHTPDVQVTLEYDGITGYGEASMPPYLGETQEGAALYRILSKDIGMTDNEIRGMGYGALAPYFDREEYARTIAEWMMDDGTESTLSGSWAVPFGNIQKRFGVDLKTDTDLRDRVSRVLYDQSDIVADFCMEEDRVRLDFFYSRCPHVYEHGAETAEPAMDQSM